MAAAGGRRGLLALGSNLGPRELHLDRAWTRLEQLGLAVLASGPRWNTRPLAAPPQPDFLNQVLLVAGPADAEGWLRLVQEVEGPRSRAVPRGPRALDVDVVAVEGLASSDPRILLPHPELAARPYLVLGGSLLAPDWRPLDGGPTFQVMAAGAGAPAWARVRAEGDPPAPGWPGAWSPPWRRSGPGPGAG